jgi:hypothetical protein
MSEHENQVPLKPYEEKKAEDIIDQIADGRNLKITDLFCCELVPDSEYESRAGILLQDNCCSQYVSADGRDKAAQCVMCRHFVSRIR